MKKVKNTRFEIVYKNLALPLTKFVVKHVGGDSKAVDEVVSETMVAAWRGWGAFRHKSSYFTWLCRIALNKISDYYRDQVHRDSKIIVPIIETLTEADPNSLSPEEAMALNDLKKNVNDCLNLLPPKKRRLLQFRYWYDMSYEEIAKIIGVSERAVEGQLYRARHDFARVWSDLSRSGP